MVEMDEIAKVGKTARVVEVIKYAWERFAVSASSRRRRSKNSCLI